MLLSQGLVMFQVLFFFFLGALLHFAFMEIEDFHIGEN